MSNSPPPPAGTSASLSHSTCPPTAVNFLSTTRNCSVMASVKARISCSLPASAFSSKETRSRFRCSLDSSFICPWMFRIASSTCESGTPGAAGDATSQKAGQGGEGQGILDRGMTRGYWIFSPHLACFFTHPIDHVHPQRWELAASRLPVCPTFLQVFRIPQEVGTSSSIY